MYPDRSLVLHIILPAARASGVFVFGYFVASLCSIVSRIIELLVTYMFIQKCLYTATYSSFWKLWFMFHNIQLVALISAGVTVLYFYFKYLAAHPYTFPHRRYDQSNVAYNVIYLVAAVDLLFCTLALHRHATRTENKSKVTSSLLLRLVSFATFLRAVMSTTASIEHDGSIFLNLVYPGSTMGILGGLVLVGKQSMWKDADSSEDGSGVMENVQERRGERIKWIPGLTWSRIGKGKSGG